MSGFDKTWFSSIEEKNKAVETAKKILKSVNMHPQAISSFLKDDELVWSICDDPERIKTWNDNHPNSPLDILSGAGVLMCVLTDMS